MMRVSLNKYSCCVLLAILLEMAAAWPAWSQGRQLERKDYGRWGNLRLENISGDGRYVSFMMNYAQGTDTLYVKDTKTAKLFSFAGGTKGIFAGTRHFVFLDGEKSLTLMDLPGGIRKAAHNVTEYRYLAPQELLLYSATENSRHYLGLMPLTAGKAIKIMDVGNHSYNENTTTVLCQRKTETGTELITVRAKGQDKFTQAVVIPSGPYSYSNLTWKQDGSACTFTRIGTGENGSAELCFYNFVSGRLNVLGTENLGAFKEHWVISSGHSSGLRLSDDGQHIFFRIRPVSNAASEKGNVQVWNAEDKYLNPVPIREDGAIKPSRLAVWEPGTGRFEVITDNAYAEAMVSGGGRYAIAWDAQLHEPQWNYEPPRDYAIYDAKTGQKKKILERQSAAMGQASLSADGWYLAYFKEGDWWVYDIRNSRHTNLTALLRGNFTREGQNFTSDTMASGLAGWYDEDEAVFLYDSNDVWRYDLAVGKARRLTLGKEEGLIYRIAASQNKIAFTMNFDGPQAPLLRKGPMVMEVSGRGRSGYAIMDPEKGSIEMQLKDKKISSMLRAGKNLAYTEQDFDSPPAVMLKTASGISKLFQSNPHHFTYAWGKSELISYRNSKGRRLDAILYYPAGYSAGKQYPMIVSIYEMQSSKVHNYASPGMANGNGINIANLTTQGYLVLLPDIVYEVGSPGYSAADCVISATRAILDRGIVQPKGIGLTGHSFGGYQTDFIITQTGLFSAAVAGAAISDLPSSYLYVSWNYKKPNFWHYEHAQLRMGTSLFANYPAYISNSPVYHAEKVTTPLLSWTGEQDRQVHYYQSIEFYLASRRLGKEHVMLIYPGEGHVLDETQNQWDLTEKIEQWFGHYLKGEKKPAWTSPNLPH